MDRDSQLTAQLAPLEGALRDAARTDADALLRDAETTAAAKSAAGAAKAHELLEQAAGEGRRAAERAAAHRLVSGKRQARGLVLSAQEAAYARLVENSIAATAGLTARPEYPEMERRLVELATGVLGPDATIVRNPDGQGGIRASGGRRHMDLTLPTLARRCVEQLGNGVTGLWS